MRWSPLPPAALAIALAGAACGGGYMSRGELLYGYPAAGVDCRGDRACAEVERHLAVIRAEAGGWCGTVLMSELHRLVAMGDAAVPTLLAELDGDGWATPHYAATALRRLGRDAEVSAWCRAATGRDTFPWVCQGTTPYARWPGLAED